MGSEQYTRNFDAQLHLITIEEYEKYSHLMPRLAPNTASLASDGLVEYDVTMTDWGPEQEDNYSRFENSDFADIKNADNEDDYDEYEEENDYYDDYYDDYYNEYDAVCEGIIVGFSDDQEILSAHDGERLTIKDIDIVVLDHEQGLFAFEATETLWVNSNTLDDYFGSYWEHKCNEISNKNAQKLNLVKKELDIPDFDKTEYELTESDFNKGTAFNQIITGETGCGKTYKAINDEIEAGRKFAYIAPCRQLAYESYRYYADSGIDTLTSGEVKINPEGKGNLYGVFESMSPEMVKDFDTLIIDEGHFINDPERGQELLSLIAACREQNVNIKILTATQTFQLNDFEQIELPARYKIPEKKEVDFTTARENIDKGMQTIWFCGSINDTYFTADMLRSEGINAISMNSSMTPSERLAAQIAFENKEVQVVCATNVLAQGVNFECENLIVEYDPYETDAQQQQKIGRLGRPGTLTDKNEVYYAVDSKREKPQKPDIKTKIEKHERNKDYIEKQLENAKWFIEHGNGEPLDYNAIKYCIPQFQEWASDFIDIKIEQRIRIEKLTKISLPEEEFEINQEYIDKIKADVENDCSKAINALDGTLLTIQQEQDSLKEIIINNMRKTPSLNLGENTSAISQLDNAKQNALNKIGINNSTGNNHYTDKVSAMNAFGDGKNKGNGISQKFAK